MSKNKLLLLPLLVTLSLTGCVKKEEPKFASDEKEKESETTEYTFYKLKPPTTEKSAKTESKLTPFEKIDTPENHEQYVKALTENIQHNFKDVVAFDADTKTRTYKISIKPSTEQKKLSGNVVEMAKQIKAVSQFIDKNTDSSQYYQIDLSYKLSDESELKVKFDFKRLVSLESNQTYLIMDTVLSTEKIDTDNLAKQVKDASCADILSKEMNPFFCGEMKKHILTTEGKSEESKTSEKDGIESLIEKETGRNNEEDTTHKKTSSLSEEERKVLVEAGFEVELN